MSDQDDTRAQTITGLRELADFLEQTPEAKAEGAAGALIYDYATTRDELLTRAAVLGGPWKPSKRAAYFMLVRSFGPVEYQLYTDASEVGAPPAEWAPDPEVTARLDALNTVEDVAA